MVKKKPQQPCSYKEFCLFSLPGSSCAVEDQAECDVAREIKETMDKPCPIMQQGGYKDCHCDIPIIRAILPHGTNCAEICQGTGREAVKSLHEYLAKTKKFGNGRDELMKIFLEIKQSKK